MTTTTTTGRKKSSKGLMIAAAGVATLLLAAGAKKASASSGGVFVPPGEKEPPIPLPKPSSSTPRETLSLAEVVGIMTAAAVTRDPVQMRAAAARLRAAGWPQHADDLELAAQGIERASKPTPMTPTPTPAPSKPPPASSSSPLPGIIPTSNPSPPATAPTVSKPPTSSTPATSSTQATIRKGSTGILVSAWQARLNTHGFGLTVDGKFGDGTHNATRDYQTDMGLTVDGIVGPQTWAANGAPILGARTLRLGSRGPAVKSWQIALLADGLKSATDGVFGADTEALTKIYQAARGIAADGIVGKQTVAAIGPRKSTSSSPAPVVATTIDPGTWRNPLRSGMSGKDVGEWQLVLRRDGYTAVVADGIFGKQTHSSTVSWQAQRKLAADGIVGPATRAAIKATAKVAGDVDLASRWRPLRPSTPMPGIIEETIPSETVQAERALAARVAHNLTFAAPEQEDRELVGEFQRYCGLNPTGAYGPGTAKKLIEFGFVPPRVRYWPSKGTLQARADYKATLLAQAKRDKSRSAEWLAAARSLDRPGHELVADGV